MGWCLSAHCCLSRGRAQRRRCVEPFPLTAQLLCACRLQVIWDCSGADIWCSGRISAYSEATESHRIEYEDGDVKWHQLRDEETLGTLRWVDPPPYHSTVAFDDSTPHYLVYNADTHLLFMYPNVCILEDADVGNPSEFVLRLAKAPHFMYVPPGPELVRQVFVKVSEPGCIDVPHKCSVALRKLASKVAATE